ncbi:MAG: lipoate--protein ligase family protein [Anaerolineaceae bacterium]|jgi:lipoate-protein ligase A|nr:MAG: lipoate--protein ligase family protein [Anaerolineaceae bacterium]
MESSFWRLIVNAPAEGTWNMAVDEAILESTANLLQPTTLRLYSWNPFCLSLGYSQSIADIDETRLKARGWDLVRRPTGGKAILHADELTYSICASNSDPHVRGSVLESYQHLSKGLIAAMQMVKLDVISEPHKSPSERNTTKPICFEVPSDYEITLNGKKIIGSAQVRKKDGVLQHGAIPLFGDIARITDVLHYESENERSLSRSQVQMRATTLEKQTDQRITWKKLAHAIVCGFENALQIEIKIGRLSDQERKRAKQLLEEKYANMDWTRRL